MKFDNKHTEIKIQSQKQLFAVIVAVVVALIFITDFWDYVYKYTGISRGLFTIILCTRYLAFYLYHIFRASSYISFNDEEGKIVIRFYQLNFFNQAKISCEIPRSQFAGYRIERKSLFKLRENVTVFRKSQGNIVRYPPFSISALTADERKKLLKTLASYSGK